MCRGTNSVGAWAPSNQKGFQLAEIIWSGLPHLSQKFVLRGNVSVMEDIFEFLCCIFGCRRNIAENNICDEIKEKTC